MRRTLVILASCVILAAGCAGTDSDAPPSATKSSASSPVIDGLIDIGGRSLYLQCLGTGGPTVIFEAGLTGDHRTWDEIVNRLSSHMRVCAYDRANIAPSEPARKPRTARDMVVDLRRLLPAAHEKPPYLVVGFSFGGIVTQLFARTHGDEVAGMVLVESNHPDEQDEFEAELTPSQIAKDREQADANEEGVDIFASFKQVQKAGALPAIPLVVITAGMSEGWPPGWDPGVFDRLRARQQADLAHMVPGGTQVIARKSAHEVPLQQPEVVIKAIESVLAQIE